MDLNIIFALPLLCLLSLNGSPRLALMAGIGFARLDLPWPLCRRALGSESAQPFAGELIPFL